MNDLIKRENAIKALDNARINGTSLLDADEAVKQLKDLLSADRPQEWIPCSERLPNEKERVESYIRNKRASEFIVMIKGANRPTTLYLSWDNYWFDENRSFYEVIAWMPLPQLYKEKHDE